MSQSEENRYSRARRRAADSPGFIDLIDTNFHSCGFRYPPGIVRGLLDSFYARGYTYDPDPAGSARLRESISIFYHTSGLAMPPESIVVTASASESYGHIFASQCSSGDRVLLPRPGYPIFEDIASRFGLEIDFYDQRRHDGWSFDPEQIEAAVQTRTRAVVLISPNNPTGFIVNEELLQAVGRTCRQNGLFIVADEVFSEFLFRSHAATPAALPRRAVVPRPAAVLPDITTFTINGVSKLFASPELKVSWIAVGGEAAERTEAVGKLQLQNDLFLSAAPANQAVVTGLLSQGLEFTHGMVKTVSERRHCMLEEVAQTPGLEAVAPSGGIHLPVTIDPGVLAEGHDDESVAVDLLSRGVAAHPGYLYGIEEPPTLIMSYLAPAERIREGFRRTRSYLSEARS